MGKSGSETPLFRNQGRHVILAFAIVGHPITTVEKEFIQIERSANQTKNMFQNVEADKTQ